jgi:DNA-binding CsgD family transcriptional regulator
VLQVVNGGAAITPSLARRLLRRMDGVGASGFARSAPGALRGGGNGNGGSGEHLSEREREILCQVAKGYTSDEIGQRLSISGQTVNTHIKNIHRKLQVRTRRR